MRFIKWLKKVSQEVNQLENEKKKATDELIALLKMNTQRGN